MKNIILTAMTVIFSGCATRDLCMEGSGMFANGKTGVVGIGTMDVEAIPETVESAYVRYSEDTAWLSPSTKTHAVKIILTGTNSTARVDGVVRSICDAFKARSEDSK